MPPAAQIAEPPCLQDGAARARSKNRQHRHAGKSGVAGRDVGRPSEWDLGLVAVLKRWPWTCGRASASVSAVRPLMQAYWSVAFVAVVAVALVGVGVAAKQPALTGAGIAFLGVTITKVVDIGLERHASRLRDLDETRRLAYTVLGVGTSGARAELVATVVNALAHHGSAVDAKIAAKHVATILDFNAADGDRDESRRWLQEQIDRITAQLGS